MAAILTPNKPIVNAGLQYVNGLVMAPGPLNADNVTTATLLVSLGQARDSTNTNDIVLPATVAAGAANPNNAPVDANAPLYTLNPARTGRNGLDTGTIAAASLYAVYAIASSTLSAQPGVLLSLSFTNPQLPEGYDMFRRIGAIATADAAARFLYFTQEGLGSVKYLWYNVPVATALAAGANLALTSFNWASAQPTNVVPLTAIAALAKVALTSDAGGTRTVVFSSNNTVTIANAATAGMVILSSPASTVTTASLVIPIQASAGFVLPAVSFFATSSTAAGVAVAVSCQGFIDQL